jgi:hemolysin activation/secretion protein
MIVLSPPVHAQSAGAPGLSRSEVLRLPPALEAAATDFGASTCPVATLAGLAQGERSEGRLESLSLAGVTAVDARALDAELQVLVGADYSREGLSRAAARVECRYREAGYLFARVSVEAETGERRYVLRVQEGVLESLEVLAPDPAMAEFALMAFAGVVRGAPLNAQAVRRGLANAAQLGVADIRPTVRRSRSNPEGIDLILVTSEPDREAFAQAANTGSESLGPWTGFAGARAHGLFGGAERTSLAIFSSLDGHEQIGAQAQVDALLSGEGLVGRLEAAVSEARPGGDIAPLDVLARTAFLSAEASYPLAIRRGFVAYARAGLEAIEQTTDFFGDVRLSSDRLRIAYAGARAEGLLPRGVWRVDLEARQGLDRLGASRPADADLSRPDADPQASVLRADAEVRALLPAGFSLRAGVSAQAADTGLAAFEEFSFGAVNGGLSLDPGAVSGDSGLAATAEIDGPAVDVGPLKAVRPLLRFAFARAWNDGLSFDADPRAASVALGARFDLGERARLDVLWAEPLEGVNRLPASLAGSRIYVQLSTSVYWPRGGLFGVSKGGAK